MISVTDIIVHILLFISLFFELFLLVTFVERTGSIVKAGRRLKRYPTVTIFVPCYNEESTVAKTVDSLLALDYPKRKLSVFVIDDGSKDKTWNVLQQYASHTQVRIFHKENGGKHTALNFGLAHATADIVGCLDADSWVAPDALKEAINYFEDPQIMAVTPAIKIHDPQSIIQHIQHAEYAVSAFVRRTFAWIDSLFITPGPFSLFRRDVFVQLGEYRAAHNTEDMEIALRMQSHHMKIENAPTAHVYTNAPRTYRTLFRQRLRWTYGFMKNAQDYRFMFFNRTYGNLGLFILPLGFFTIFPAIYFTGISIVSAAQQASLSYERYQVLGFRMPSFSFNWFYMTTHSVVFLTMVIFVVMIAIIWIGKRLMGEEKIWTKDVLLYMFLYGFLAPWWLMRAVYATMFSSSKLSWAKEIDQRRAAAE